MEITKKQRNFMLACGAVLIVSYVVRSVENSSMQAQYYRQIAQQRQKALELQANRARGLGAGPSVVTLGVPGVTSLSNLSGAWVGRDGIANHGICTVNLELRETEAEHYGGYFTLTCPPNLLLQKAQAPGAIYAQANSAISVLSGAPDNGAIRFHVDKVVSPDPDGCSTSSFSVTPFGTNKIAAQWQEGTCQGGQVVLQRTGR